MFAEDYEWSAAGRVVGSVGLNCYYKYLWQLGSGVSRWGEDGLYTHAGTTLLIHKTFWRVLTQGQKAELMEGPFRTQHETICKLNDSDLRMNSRISKPQWLQTFNHLDQLFNISYTLISLKPIFFIQRTFKDLMIFLLNYSLYSKYLKSSEKYVLPSCPSFYIQTLSKK